MVCLLLLIKMHPYLIPVVILIWIESSLLMRSSASVKAVHRECDPKHWDFWMLMQPSKIMCFFCSPEKSSCLSPYSLGLHGAILWPARLARPVPCLSVHFNSQSAVVWFEYGLQFFLDDFCCVGVGWLYHNNVANLNVPLEVWQIVIPLIL